MSYIDKIVVLCYDISDDSIRQKISRLCEKTGGIRVQKSVFEFHRITYEDLIWLLREIEKINKNPAPEDAVSVYFVSKNDYEKKMNIALGEKKKEKFRVEGAVEEV